MNFCQLVVTLLFFLPYTTRIRACQFLANTWWEIWCFMIEVWSGIPYRFTGDAVGECENAILIGNHERGIDFTTGIVVVSRANGIGCGRMMTMMKKSLLLVPGIGWTHYFQGSLFLSRSWEKDETALRRKLNDIETARFPHPFWVGIYPEGTRITTAKRAQSHVFAKQKNLPILQHVLLPRTKGFTFLMASLPTSVQVIYDVTAAYEGSPLYPSHPLLYGGFATRSVHVHIDRIPIASLPRPDDEAALSEWLVERFRRKDALLTEFATNGRFPGEEASWGSHEQDRRKRYRAVFVAWAMILTFVCYAVLRSTPLFNFMFVLIAATLHKVNLAGRRKKSEKRE